MKIFGYKIFKEKYLDEVFFNRENFLNFFYKKDEALNIFDIGANEGQSIEYFKKLFINSSIHAFEPEIVNFRKLNTKYKDDTTVYTNNFALGDKEEDKFLNCYTDSAQNSFFKIDKNSEAIRHNAHPKVTKCVDDENTKLVNIQTLDSYVFKYKLQKINIVKIDVQGFENQVLLGSLQSISKNIIDIFIVEISFDGVYGVSNSFAEIEKILIPNNYVFWDISHIYKDLSRGRTCWVDAVYIDKNFIEAKDENK